MSLEEVLFLELEPHAGPTYHTICSDLCSIPWFQKAAALCKRGICLVKLIEAKAVCCWAQVMH